MTRARKSEPSGYVTPAGRFVQQIASQAMTLKKYRDREKRGEIKRPPCDPVIMPRRSSRDANIK